MDDLLKFCFAVTFTDGNFTKNLHIGSPEAFRLGIGPALKKTTE